jgi:hypothetical protein
MAEIYMTICVRPENLALEPKNHLWYMDIQNWLISSKQQSSSFEAKLIMKFTAFYGT